MRQVSICLCGLLTELKFEARRIWRDYFASVDAVIFIVDANDRSRFEESKEELDVRRSGFSSLTPRLAHSYF